MGSRRGQWLGVVMGLLIAVPVLLTLASALTSPPHVRGVPTGRLIYLEADEPSDHTALLRGLRIMGPDGDSRQLLHETEPQDRDAGSREWISQPQASPDGRWLAFEKQIITLQEEQQGIDNQLWVMPLTGPNPQPRMLLDLTKSRLKQFLGLAWTTDGRSVIFLEDSTAYFCPTGDSSRVTKRVLEEVPPGSVTAGASATRYPGMNAEHALVYTTARPRTANRPEAISLDGTQTASVSPTAAGTIDVSASGARPQIRARWGWSVFGGRHITALKWSPDGKYLAYSVSKPPLEDELFYIDLATGRCFQLPVRTGRAGWDWAR